MTKVIILGMNRTGTKLASYEVSHACGLNDVYLEPFTWDSGIDILLSKDWAPQQKLRKESQQGRAEHKKLDILCSANIQSQWLNNLLKDERWYLIKFIEIGRCDLHHAYFPKFFIY